jgi:Transposase DDE domain
MACDRGPLPRKVGVSGRVSREARALIGEIQENCPPFRADAGFANPDVYEFLEAKQIKYAIRLTANRVLWRRSDPAPIAHAIGASAT